MHPTRLLKTAEEMKEWWIKYKKHLQENESQKWLKVQYVGKDGERVTDAPPMPLTYEGFKVYMYENLGVINQYFENKDELYDDFVEVCSHIKEEIRANQIQGGLLGYYNPSITQRLNGLADKQEHEIKGEPRIFNLGD
jgi:hypothetical protein